LTCDLIFKLDDTLAAVMPREGSVRQRK